MSGSKINKEMVVSLVPIEFEIFSGGNKFARIKFIKWLDVFSDLVLNGLFNASEKLRILRKHLTLSASLLVANAIHEENFESAVDKFVKT